MTRVSRMAVALIATLAALAAYGQSPAEIFNSSNQAYDRNLYDEAAEGYRSLLRYQIEDPRVEYNLGNAEFRRGNLGQAILHFERARRLDPTDPDIRNNLEYARSLRIDRVPQPELSPLVRGWRRLQDSIGPDRQAWALLGLVWTVSALLGLGLATPGRWSARHGWALAGLLVLVAVVGASWYTTYKRLEGRAVAVILADAVEVLAGPGPNNATLATVHEGLDVEVRGIREEWLQVRLPNGISGWIASDAAERI